jgi:hypothetical protein
VSIKLPSREATATKLFRDLPKLLNEDFGCKCIDATPIKTKLRTIQSGAPHAV